jgi:hypothetical protein
MPPTRFCEICGNPSPESPCANCVQEELDRIDKDGFWRLNELREDDDLIPKEEE